MLARTSRRSLLLLLLPLLLLGLAPGSAAGAADDSGDSSRILVFAAASLTDALQAVAEAYQAQSGDVPVLSFASSSTLARQINQGAPADVYVSANLKWMDFLAQHDRLLAPSRRNLLANRLALVAPVSSPLDEVAITNGFAIDRLLGEARLAMGDPAHVPAGIYGKQALQTLHVWSKVQHRVAASANVRAALALVALGETPLGIVYRTDALASQRVKVVGLFPASSHTPIVYPAALTRTAKDNVAARAFLEFLSSATATDIFTQYGFQPLAD